MSFERTILSNTNRTAGYLTTALTVLLLAGLGLWAPNQAGVVIFKVCLVSLACLVGYWMDKVLFPQYQVSDFRKAAEELRFSSANDRKVLHKFMIAAQIRRAIILFASVVGVCLGL